ncbi:MAG: hypothetical protein WAV73_02420 [Candidatus Moraniibacteriota bacterium]
MELKDASIAKLPENSEENPLEKDLGELGPEKKLEGLDKDICRQVKNEIAKLNEVITESPDSEDGDVVSLKLEEGSAEVAVRKKRGTTFVKAVAIAMVLTGFSSFAAKTAEARGVIADMISIGFTGHTEDEWKAEKKARVKVYNNAVNRSERAKDVMFQEWSRDVKNQRNNIRSNPADKKIEAANWKLVQEALNNLKKDPRYDGNEQGRIDAGQKILDDYHKRINGLQ